MNPIKPTIKTEIFPLIMIFLSGLTGYYFYHHFPATVVTHWNYAGTPDGWGSGHANAVAIPLVLAGMYLLFFFLPYLDPKKERYEQFAKVYHIFKSIIIGFLAIIFFATGLFNLGYQIPIGKIVPVLIGALFIVIGNYMGKIKFNWFVGVKTPWTLSSEEVWNKTHRFFGKIFIASGIILAINAWIPGTIGMIIFFANMAMLVLGGFIYSYIAYRQEQKSKIK